MTRVVKAANLSIVSHLPDEPRQNLTYCCILRSIISLLLTISKLVIWFFVVRGVKKQADHMANLFFFYSIISRILYYVVIYLGLLSPKGSSNLPTGSDGPPFHFTW